MRKSAVFVPVSFSFCLLVSGFAFGQHSANGASSMGTAVPSGSTSSGGGSSSSSGGGGSSSDGSGGGSTGGYSSGGGRRAINVDRTPRTATTNNGVFTNYAQLSAPIPTFSRPRNGLPSLGTAVPRGSVPATSPGGLTFISGSYNPWIYAYDGFAGTPLFGLYDPFGANFGYPGSGPVWTPSTLTSSKSEKGVLNLDVRPYDAKVYVDGELVGSADQFEGFFHKLRIEAGVHRVELRAPGYETVVVNVRIMAGESMTYRGTLEKIAP